MGLNKVALMHVTHFNQKTPEKKKDWLNFPITTTILFAIICRFELDRDLKKY